MSSREGRRVREIIQLAVYRPKACKASTDKRRFAIYPVALLELVDAQPAMANIAVVRVRVWAIVRKSLNLILIMPSILTSIRRRSRSVFAASPPLSN